MSKNFGRSEIISKRVTQTVYELRAVGRKCRKSRKRMPLDYPIRVTESPMNIVQVNGLVSKRTDPSYRRSNIS